MLLKDEDISEFRRIYEEEFNELLTDQEAGIMASRLIAAYEALARPLPSEMAQFTDSREGSRLELEVGPDQEDKPPASEKVVL